VTLGQITDKKESTTNWDYSAYCIKVSNRSRLLFREKEASANFGVSSNIVYSMRLQLRHKYFITQAVRASGFNFLIRNLYKNCYW